MAYRGCVVFRYSYAPRGHTRCRPLARRDLWRRRPQTAPRVAKKPFKKEQRSKVLNSQWTFFAPLSPPFAQVTLLTRTTPSSCHAGRALPVPRDSAATTPHSRRRVTAAHRPRVRASTSEAAVGLREALRCALVQRRHDEATVGVVEDEGRRTLKRENRM